MRKTFTFKLMVCFSTQAILMGGFNETLADTTSLADSKTHEASQQQKELNRAEMEAAREREVYLSRIESARSQQRQADPAREKMEAERKARAEAAANLLKNQQTPSTQDTQKDSTPRLNRIESPRPAPSF